MSSGSPFQFADSFQKHHGCQRAQLMFPRLSSTRAVFHESESRTTQSRKPRSDNLDLNSDQGPWPLVFTWGIETLSAVAELALRSRRRAHTGEADQLSVEGRSRKGRSRYLQQGGQNKRLCSVVNESRCQLIREYQSDAKRSPNFCKSTSMIPALVLIGQGVLGVIQLSGESRAPFNSKSQKSR